jgi:hypothetical protein
MNRKEKCLLYAFIFGNMILLNLYQSWIIAFMLSEPSFTSIQTIKELNESDTKIFRFLAAQNVAKDEICFRDEMIINKIHAGFYSDLLLFKEIPQQFDPNLAYAVNCDYAEAFVRSDRNFDGGKMLFDLMKEPISTMPATYSVLNSFPLKEEFQRMHERLVETGLMDHWTKNVMNEQTDKNAPQLLNTNKSVLVSDDIKFPFVVLLFGAVIGLITLLLEIAFYNFKRLLIYQKMKNVERFQKKSTLKSSLDLKRTRQVTQSHCNNVDEEIHPFGIDA